MTETNTVTISIEEYFELRSKAELHMTMLREMAYFEARSNELAEKISELRNEISQLKRGHT